MPNGILPSLNYTGNDFKDEVAKGTESVAYKSDIMQAEFCLHLMWRHQAHPGNYTGIEGQETCKRNWDTTY